jgi:hypothetical protein
LAVSEGDLAPSTSRERESDRERDLVGGNPLVGKPAIGTEPLSKSVGTGGEGDGAGREGCVEGVAQTSENTILITIDGARNARSRTHVHRSAKKLGTGHFKNNRGENSTPVTYIPSSRKENSCSPTPHVNKRTITHDTYNNHNADISAALRHDPDEAGCGVSNRGRGAYSKVEKKRKEKETQKRN